MELLSLSWQLTLVTSWWPLKLTSTMFDLLDHVQSDSGVPLIIKITQQCQQCRDRYWMDSTLPTILLFEHRKALLKIYSRGFLILLFSLSLDPQTWVRQIGHWRVSNNQDESGGGSYIDLFWKFGIPTYRSWALCFFPLIVTPSLMSECILFEWQLNEAKGS